MSHLSYVERSDERGLPYDNEASHPLALDEGAQRHHPNGGEQKRGRFGDEFDGHVVHDKLVLWHGRKGWLTAERTEIETVDVRVIERE